MLYRLMLLSVFSGVYLLISSCNPRTERQDINIEISVVKVFFEDTINFSKIKFIINIKNNTSDDKAFLFNKLMDKNEEQSDNTFNAKLELFDSNKSVSDLKLIKYFPDKIWVKSKRSQNYIFDMQTKLDSSFYRQIGDFRDSTINNNSRLDFRLLLSRLDRNDTITGYFSKDTKVYNRPAFPYDLN